MKRSPLKRKTPLRSTTGLKRGKRLRPVNRKRRASEFARAYGSRARVAWVKSLPCVVGLTCWGPVVNAHIESGGRGRKADARFIVPLCHWHHHMVHQHGLSFYHHLNWLAEAERVEALWQLHGAAGDVPPKVLAVKGVRSDARVQDGDGGFCHSVEHSAPSVDQVFTGGAE